MSLVAEIRTPVDTLALSSTLRAVPEMTVEVEREVAIDPTGPFLSFWAFQGSFCRFERELDDDPTVTDATRLAVCGRDDADGRPQSGDDRRLYRIQIADETTTLYPAYVRLGATLLELVGTADGWDAKLRVPSREALVEFRERCLDAGVEFSLQRLYDADSPTLEADVGLTEPQREALTVALDRGYFDVPRESSLAELGRALGVSDQAASERIRRGVRSVLTDALDADESGSSLDRIESAREKP